MSNSLKPIAQRPARASREQGSATTRYPAASLLGLAAGIGLFLIPGSAHAGGGVSYGHAEVTIGFPNGQVTVGRAWGEHPREIIVERRSDRDCDRERDYDDDDYYDDGPDVVIERRHPHRHCRRVVIERYERPRCDR